MPSIYDLKPAFQRCLEPFMRQLAQWRVTPNQITSFALLLSVAGGVMVLLSAQKPVFLLWLPLLLLIRMALNALDGMLARRYQQSSRLGEVLNEVGDIASDTCLYLPFILLVPDSMAAIALISLFVALGVTCEFTGILAKAITGTRAYHGPMGKSDRAFAMSLYALALYAWPTHAIPISLTLFALLNALLLLSSFNRMKSIVNPSLTSAQHKDA